MLFRVAMPLPSPVRRVRRSPTDKQRRGIHAYCRYTRVANENNSQIRAISRLAARSSRVQLGDDHLEFRGRRRKVTYASYVHVP